MVRPTRVMRCCRLQCCHLTRPPLWIFNIGYRVLLDLLCMNILSFIMLQKYEQRNDFCSN